VGQNKSIKTTFAILAHIKEGTMSLLELRSESVVSVPPGGADDGGDLH